MAVDQIKVSAKKYSSLKHHICKMHFFENYIRDDKVRDRLKRSIEFIKDELLESVDIRE